MGPAELQDYSTRPEKAPGAGLHIPIDGGA